MLKKECLDLEHCMVYFVDITLNFEIELAVV